MTDILNMASSRDGGGLPKIDITAVLRFLERQQQAKQRQGDAQTAQECRTTAAARAADIGRHLEQEANHV